MNILTLDDIVKLEPNDPITGLTALIKHVFVAKSTPDKRTPGATQAVQRVILKDGREEMWLEIVQPGEGEASKFISVEDKGKKLYAYQGVTATGKPSGLKRGRNWTKPETGEVVRFVELSGVGEWGFQERQSTPKAQDDLPVFGEAPKPAEDPQPVTQLAESNKSIILNPIPKSLAALTLQHRQCLEAVLDTARSQTEEVGDVTGGQWTDVAIALMANALWEEARKQQIWK